MLRPAGRAAAPVDPNAPEPDAVRAPEGWEGHVVLRDGGLAFVRPVRADDAALLASLHERLSDESKYLRYFTARPSLPQDELLRAVSVDYRDRMAFVAFVQGELVAYACYVRGRGEPAAEIAFQVEDSQQGRGLGTLLLEQLAAYAQTQGLHCFRASLLAHNRRMIEVFRDAGFPRRLRREDGVIEVSLEIDPTRHSREAIARRHAEAHARAQQRLERARSDRS